jgi:hypothetical protein
MTGQQIEDIVDAVVDACSAVLKKRVAADVPRVLYHFTDMQGLLGIASGSTLWASLATSTNDSNEVKYGVQLAARFLDQYLKENATEFALTTRAFLENPAAVEPCTHFEMPGFVVSLCETVDTSGPWLQYGDSGAGVALGLLSKGIAVPPFDLVKIDYSETSQLAQIGELLNAVQEAARPFVAGRSEEDAPLVGHMAAELAALYLRVLATTFKSGSFTNESEWRLVTWQVLENGRAVTLGSGRGDLKFRLRKGRPVAYDEVSIRPFPLVEIILGHSSATGIDDPSLRMLLKQTGRAVAVSKSGVTVR